MKKLLLLALLSVFAVSGLTNMNPFNKKIELKDVDTKRTDVELCKTSIKYAHAYKDTMAKDEAAKTALNYYKKDVVANCGKISSRAS